jgi:uncharacterized membrane protein YphA (DoxX/SURF4 family)
MLPHLASGLSVCLAAVFAVAAVAKAMGFRRTTQSFRSLRIPLPHVAAIGVPMLEAIAAALLIVRPRFGATLALVLLIVFTAFLASRLREGQQIRCSCFGALGDDTVSTTTMLRNALLILAGAAVVIWADPLRGGQELIVSLTLAGSFAVIALCALTLWDIKQSVGTLFSQRVVPPSHGNGHVS